MHRYYHIAQVLRSVWQTRLGGILESVWYLKRSGAFGLSVLRALRTARAEWATQVVSLLDPGRRSSRAAFGPDSEPVFLAADRSMHHHVTVNQAIKHKEPTALQCHTQRRADRYGKTKAACNGQMKHATPTVRYFVTTS